MYKEKPRYFIKVTGLIFTIICLIYQFLIGLELTKSVIRHFMNPTSDMLHLTSQTIISVLIKSPLKLTFSIY
jgi:hypothetical protein